MIHKNTANRILVLALSGYQAVKLRYMQNPGTAAIGSESSLHELELVERELKAALIFAKFSSTSYSLGKLQHATDARSKAKAVCTRAAQRLATPEVIEVGTDSVRLILHEVENALAHLPARIEFKPQVQRAGS
jgi:hypothetical protein